MKSTRTSRRSTSNFEKPREKKQPADSLRPLAIHFGVRKKRKRKKKRDTDLERSKVLDSLRGQRALSCGADHRQVRGGWGEGVDGGGGCVWERHVNRCLSDSAGTNMSKSRTKKKSFSGGGGLCALHCSPSTCQEPDLRGEQQGRLRLPRQHRPEAQAPVRCMVQASKQASHIAAGRYSPNVGVVPFFRNRTPKIMVSFWSPGFFHAKTTHPIWFPALFLFTLLTPLVVLLVSLCLFRSCEAVR